MNYIKLEYYINKSDNSDFTEDEMKSIAQEYLDSMNTKGYIISGETELVSRIPKKPLLTPEDLKIKTRNDELKKNYVRVGETMMQHNKKYEAYKTTPQVFAAHNAIDIKERTKEDKLILMEQKICKSGFKILLVDDDKDVILSNLSSLQDLGFCKVKTANSGEEAVDLMNQFNFNLILSDYKMEGGMTGFGLFTAIRNIPSSIKPNFVLVTGYTAFEQEELKKAGILVLPKPFNLDKLRIVVEGFYLKYLEKIEKKILVDFYF
jgi:CheY-like chemotaxis protein